ALRVRRARIDVPGAQRLQSGPPPTFLRLTRVDQASLQARVNGPGRQRLKGHVSVPVQHCPVKGCVVNLEALPSAERPARIVGPDPAPLVRQDPGSVPVAKLDGTQPVTGRI